MRRFSGIVVVAFAVVSFLGLTCLSGATSAQQPAIKIGMVYPVTGPLAAQGVPMVNAIKQAFDEDNYTIAGRKIDVIIEDSQGKPDFGLTKFRKLIEGDRVHILKAEITTAVALGVAPYVHSQHIPWITEAAAGALARGLRSPYTFRFVPSEYQYSYASAQWLKNKMGWKKIYWIAWDTAVTRGGVKGFQKVFGDEMVDAMWSPVGTADYGPFLARVSPEKADGIVVAMWGADALRIMRQIGEYGLKARLPVFGLASFTSEELLPVMPAEIEGVLSAYPYCGSLNTPANRRFVDGYRTRYNALPGSYQYMAYAGAKIVVQAMKDVGGNVEDKESFVSALRKIKFDGPMGLVGFDERQGGVFDFYVLKVVRKDGQLQNECIEKIAQVKDPYDLFP